MAERFLIRDVAAAATAPGATVSEGRQKKLALIKKLTAEKESAVAARKEARKRLRQELKERTLRYEEEYEAREKELQEIRAKVRTEKCFYKEDDPKVVFAIRLKGINKLAPKPKKILQLFRLRQLHNGVFIKINKATTEMLKTVSPFITFGYPSRAVIRELIYKRGHAKIGKPGAYSRIRIQDNHLITENLGKYGIDGVEDIIHEITTCGPHFKQATNFLWPFKLHAPRGGFVAKRRGFCDPLKGDWGNRERHINELVRKMN